MRVPKGLTIKQLQDRARPTKPQTERQKFLIQLRQSPINEVTMRWVLNHAEANQEERNWAGSWLHTHGWL